MSVSTRTRRAATAGRSTALTAGYYVAFVALGLSGASLGPTLPGLAEHTGSQLSQVSFLFTARSLGYLLGSFRGGRLYDRAPGHPVMAGALLLMAALLAAVPLVPLLWLLVVALLLLGAAEGALDVGGNTLLVWLHGERVGPFMNGLHFCFGAGAFLAPVVVAQAVLLSGDITWAYFALALLMLPAAVWILHLPSPAGRAASPGAPAHGANPLPIALFALFFFLHVGAETSFGGWIYTYAVALNLADKTSAAYLTSAFWGALTAGRLLAIPIAARFPPRTMLLADLLGCLAGAGTILLWPASTAALWLGTIVAGLSIASVFPTSISLAERRLTITGQTTGWLLVGSSLGGMSLPWLIGQLFESVGPQVTVLTIAAGLLAALGVLAALLLYAPRPQAERA